MLGWAAGIWFTRQDVAAISLLGLILDVAGGLYLAHEVLGRKNGVLRYLTHGIIPHLSKWDQRVVGIHERAQVGEPRGEVGQGMDAEPGEQEAGTDEGLQEEP